jgi:hypothetical protein
MEQKKVFHCCRGFRFTKVLTKVQVTVFTFVFMGICDGINENKLEIQDDSLLGYSPV